MHGRRVRTARTVLLHSRGVAAARHAEDSQAYSGPPRGARQRLNAEGSLDSATTRSSPATCRRPTARMTCRSPVQAGDALAPRYRHCGGRGWLSHGPNGSRVAGAALDWAPRCRLVRRGTATGSRGGDCRCSSGARDVQRAVPTPASCAEARVRVSRLTPLRGAFQWAGLAAPHRPLILRAPRPQPAWAIACDPDVYAQRGMASSPRTEVLVLACPGRFGGVFGG
jgi:hypothetical protein